MTREARVKVMKEDIEALRRSYRLYKREGRATTVIAVAIITIVVGPYLRRYLQERSESRAEA